MPKAGYLTNDGWLKNPVIYQVKAAMEANTNKMNVKEPVNLFFFFFATILLNACKSAENHLNRKDKFWISACSCNMEELKDRF